LLKTAFEHPSTRSTVPQQKHKHLIWQQIVRQIFLLNYLKFKSIYIKYFASKKSQFLFFDKSYSLKIFFPFLDEVEIQNLKLRLLD